MKEDYIYLEFARRIRCRIVTLKINRREVARRAGINESTLSRYMNGHRKPTYDIVIRIAQALECKPGELIDIYTKR